jgi:hypothetical protein
LLCFQDVHQQRSFTAGLNAGELVWTRYARWLFRARKICTLPLSIDVRASSQKFIHGAFYFWR